jgi:tetratricopeptide (TPR) repeat protein
MYKILFILFVPCCLISSNLAFGQNLNGASKPDSATMRRVARVKVDSLTNAMKGTSNPTMLAFMYMRRASGEAILGLVDSAITDYTKAVTLNPRLADAYLLRGSVYEQQKQYQASITDAETALPLLNARSTRLTYVYSGIAFDQYKLKNYTKSLEADSIAIVLNPNNTQAYANTGWAYLATQKYDKAIEYFTAGIAGYHNDNKRMAKLIVARADAKRALKKYREAVNDYSLAIQADPTDKLAYWNKASCYYQNGDYELADQEYTKTIPYYKGDSLNLARLFDDRAQMKIGEQKYKEALRDDSIAILYNNKQASAYWNSANAYAQNGDFQLSIDWYNKSMKYYEGNHRAMAAVYDAIANEAYFLAQYDIVIETSSSSIALYDRAWSPYLNRGRAYLKQSKKDLAANDFEKVLNLDTTKKSYEYAFALFYTGKPDDAIQVMQNNVVTTTNNAQLISHYYNIACLYSLMNKPDEANTYLKKCIDGGYSKKYAQSDPDLENIKGTQDFIAMMKTN